jgi:ribonuclease-3
LRASARSQDYQRLFEAHRSVASRLPGLEERLGHRFRDQELLLEALTHRSALMERGTEQLRLPWNERLEFLGDAVLGLAVSRRLMERGRDFAEGELSRIRSAVVNEGALAVCARAVGLGACLLLGRGAALAGGRDRDSLLANGLEAVLGAVFVDAGFAAADAVVGRLLGARLDGDLTAMVTADFKTMLQEITQDRLKLTPTYEVIESFGPDHDKVFEVRVLVGSREVGRGRGPSKKRASQEAARHAVETLGTAAFESWGTPC